ncbi:negative acting factor [Colletotrichum chrysophilum]|uniref:Negative acting factor n=1 Tax=Colletotrichum chrysophilum TaxID=1836956 RepID=A0AAD9A001_9PEZI|nr:negative acting factor [Colletotrichum chrysophilum]
MANNQPPGHPRSYPSPNNFPSPMPQGQYAYHQPTQPPPDPYRASPGAPVPSLPSMKSLDHHYPSAAPQHQPMPMQMPMAPNAGMPYYLPPGVQNPYLAQDMNSMRYALPPGHHHDPRLMRGPGGPKKEIKRRTKTGCLTCRKRRIKRGAMNHVRVPGSRPPAPAPAGRSNLPFLQKNLPHCTRHRQTPNAKRQCQCPPRPQHVSAGLASPRLTLSSPHLTSLAVAAPLRPAPIGCDEAHPTCNNCKKSKRECLGYDPIFKQQPGPSAIQPAPNTQRVPTPTIPSVPSSVPPTVPTVPSTPAAPAPVSVASSNPYGNQPAVLPSSYNATVASSHAPLDPALSSAASSVKAEPNSYDFAAPIDPALQSLPAQATISSTHHQPFSAEQRAGFDNHLRVTKMKIDELIGLLGPAAPTQEIALTPEIFGEIISIYNEVYAVGLQSFFETNWFHAKDAQGKFALEHNQPIISQFASFVKVLQAVPANDHTQMAHSGVLEARLIWALASMPCSGATMTANTDAKFLPSPEDLTEAANRVRVFETLLSGDFLPSNPLAPPVPDANPHRQQEFEFWHNLAQYLCHHDAAKRDEILGNLRLQLGGRENRDLIYSIAISREISPRVEPGFERNIPQHMDESDPKNRLYVANKFIQDEAQVTGGTTNIVRRFSEIAVRSFISPGVNIARGSSIPGQQ